MKFLDENGLIYFWKILKSKLVGIKTNNSGEIFNDYINNSATAINSHAEGEGTQATNQGETALGRYNLSNAGSTIFSVGNGTSLTNRKNAFEVKQDGSIYIQEPGTNNSINLYNSIIEKQPVNIPVVSIKENGLMLSEDKIKLDSLKPSHYIQLPTEVGGSDNSYWHDGFSQNDNIETIKAEEHKIVIVGGGSMTGPSAGMFSQDTIYNVNSVLQTIGTRLTYTP